MPPGEERFERAGFDVRALLADPRVLPTGMPLPESRSARDAVAGPWAGVGGAGVGARAAVSGRADARAGASPWATR